jgi:VanZ family protein
VFIFLNSAQVSDISTSYSRDFTRWILQHFVKGFDALDSSGQQSMIEKVNVVIRKCAHFTEYTILGFVITMLFFQYPRLNKLGGKMLIISILFCMLYAVTDEVHQLFVSGRSGKVLDVLIDTSGSAFGSVLALGIHRLICKIKKY